MKRSRFDKEQIISVLKEREVGLGTADLFRKLASAVPPSTSGRPSTAGWKCLMPVGEDTGEENARLKKLLAKAIPENAILKDVSAKKVTPEAQRDALAQACLVRGGV